MLLRSLQKGLTFHNIPLMLGITAQDDENVVYSKQIGVEENNGKAPRGPCHLPGEKPSSQGCLGLSVQAGPGFREGTGVRSWQAPTLTPAGSSGEAAIAPRVLLSTGLRAPAAPWNVALPI